MQDIQQRLLATFQIEHRDHVETIRSLLTATRKPGAPPSGPELEEAFRRAHSLKGAARAVDLRPIEGLAHRLETLFSRVRKGECALDGEITGVLHQVLDASEDAIAALAENRSADTVPAALRAIDKVLGMASPDTEPPAEVKVPGAGFQPVATVRITAQSFDGLFRTAGRLTGESRRQDQVGGELSGLERNIALLGKESERVRRCAAAALHQSRELARLMPLLDSMERQLRGISRQVRSAQHLHRRSSWSLRQLGKQLQRDVWQARMVPAESLLEGCRRMMRDLARDEGKEIEFRAAGTDVRADRRVLEALKDPIMHLLRNAVSHGIESAAERIAKGKNRTGVVTLQIDANGQALSVTVQDDGRGVDRERVAEVGVREGIISEAEAARRSPQELTRILFRPGFSTAAHVTSLSGRGMGLSVVHEAVRRLQGDLDLREAAGGGTIVHISAPLSVATGRFVVVECGGRLFAVPIRGIERLTRIRRSDIGTAGGKPVIVFNGRQVPLAGIHGLLGLEAPASRADREMLQVVILRSGSLRIALGVDAVRGETDAVIQDLGAAAGCGGRIPSGIVLDDGAVAFPVNPMELIESALDPQWQPQAFPVAAVEPEEPAACSILVVDDSMTTRALEKSILEAHGYKVRLAVDGVDALARLRTETAQLVIADIEMPRLNGFGLIEAMKQDRELRNIPVIIVSSVERREDQERGLALGADAYIVKRKFDQVELLTAIRQILR